ncbi:MAG TPA: lysylphosphatidylglycerol synthase transmembrane domain-containing protein [Gemmatimonadaceae bacterium]|nr:lysylphosphatidylglycerol synthase transmembrane domain-containing protein [Gemmatimonadaceae bacterium]
MKLWVKVAVSASLLALLFVLLPWHDVRDAFSRLPLSVWALVLAGFLLGHQVGVVKWRLLVNAGNASLRLIDATRCYAAGLFANLCLPSIVGGDVLRAALAGKATGRAEAALMGGVADRAIDIVTMCVLIAGGTLMIGGQLSGEWRMIAPAILFLGVMGLLAAMPFVLRRPLTWWPRRVRRPLGRSLVALRRLLRDRRAAAIALLLSLIIQSSFVVLNYWIGRAVGVETTLAVWFLVWPLAKVAGLLPISLGGLAVRDATLGALLLPFGVPLARGVVAALVWQTVMIAGGLVAGVVWWALAQKRHVTSELPSAALAARTIR